jgi:predicted transcriptional regulator
MPANECIPYYEDATRITVKAEAAVTGKRFVDVSDPLSSDGNIVVSHATAKGKAVGVVSHDAAEGKRVTLLRAPLIVPVTASGTIEPGEEVQVATGGKAVKFSDGRAVGVALAKATDGNDCKVALYLANPAS